MLSLLGYVDALTKRASALESRTQRALMRAANRGVVLARRRTQEVAFDTGAMASGWRSEERGDDAAAVVNVKLHAPYVDDGRSAGAAPPIAVLVRWVERRMGVGGREAERIALSIARKIAARGIAGKQIAAWLAKQLAPIAAEEVTREMGKRL